MIDSTDLSTPLEQVDGCAANCRWGAVSIANDGASGISWNYATMEEAKIAANNWCQQNATEACFTSAAVGSAWIAGVQCEIVPEDGSGGWHRSSVAFGNDLGAAIRNTFRLAVQDGTFTLDQCVLKTYVAVDGAHAIIDQPVDDPPAVASGPAPLPIVEEPPPDAVASIEPPRSTPSVAEGKSIAEDPSSYWTFYGSNMYMTARGENRSFFFDAPRQGLFEAGIVHGTPFFKGRLIGSSFSGQAFAYAKNCPSLTYAMNGTLSADGRHITFVGRRPSRDDQCNVTAMKAVTVHFDFNR